MPRINFLSTVRLPSLLLKDEARASAPPPAPVHPCGRALPPVIRSRDRKPPGRAPSARSKPRLCVGPTRVLTLSRPLPAPGHQLSTRETAPPGPRPFPRAPALSPTSGRAPRPNLPPSSPPFPTPHPTLLGQLFHSCLTSGVTVGAAVLTATLHTTRNKPHHTKLTMEDTVYCRGPVL